MTLEVDADPNPEPIRRGQIYTAENIIDALGISPTTLNTWCDDGLKRARKSTKSFFYLGDHIIDFLFAS